MRGFIEVLKVIGFWLGVLIAQALLLSFTPIETFFLAPFGRWPITLGDSLVLSFWIMMIVTLVPLAIFLPYALWQLAKRRRGL